MGCFLYCCSLYWWKDCGNFIESWIKSCYFDLGFLILWLIAFGNGASFSCFLSICFRFRCFVVIGINLNCCWRVVVSCFGMNREGCRNFLFWGVRLFCGGGGLLCILLLLLLDFTLYCFIRIIFFLWNISYLLSFSFVVRS